MTQLLVVSISTPLTPEAKADLRKDIADQLEGCDVRVLMLPAHVEVRALPPIPFLSPLPGFGPQDDVMSIKAPGAVQANDIVREVQHVDVPDDEPAGIPPHVWLYRKMLTDLQALAPLGRDETNGQYAVAIDDLTDEQRAIPHVKAQLDRMYLNDEIDGAVYFHRTSTLT